MIANKHCLRQTVIRKRVDVKQFIQLNLKEF